MAGAAREEEETVVESFQGWLQGEINILRQSTEISLGLEGRRKEFENPFRPKYARSHLTVSKQDQKQKGWTKSEMDKSVNSEQTGPSWTICLKCRQQHYLDHCPEAGV